MWGGLGTSCLLIWRDGILLFWLQFAVRNSFSVVLPAIEIVRVISQGLVLGTTTVGSRLRSLECIYALPHRREVMLKSARLIKL